MSEQRTTPKTVMTSGVIYTLLICYLVITLFPMLWLFMTSLKPSGEVFDAPFAPPAVDALALDNFSRAWTAGSFGDYFFNSVLVTACTVTGVVFIGAMAAYALARFAFPGSRALLFYFLGGLMIPLQLAVVPLFFQLKAMGLLSSRVGLVLVYIGVGLPFAIFILTGFFRSLPKSLHEAALLDGCTEFGAFTRVMLPLARPGLITVAIFSFIGTWNEYFLAFMFLSGEGSEALRTLPLGLANVTIVSQYKVDWGMVFAGLVIIVIPTLIIYLLLQRHLTKGVTLGAVKG
ncbi:carbohydrate ABC transporter permease [Mucisphaera calidilacus]|uniref:sn-glycerol-3-phosphate transport system permease protein UgpE n=1 Tax=Mucisphaera calidilacus TaxID=2527982 RepID=A0A518BV92_9BACT|nr:carbohydrate ABC transporter permease [Mucisphaera calidilacus]QDU70867.1 Trehalose transport system permease protein SugB [Mucisphaera calidilacus]